MELLLYFQQLYSNRRNKLIDMCVDLQKHGKNFIYILPSREAIRDVRYKLLEKLGGIIDSQVIMFDELERALTEDSISNTQVILDDVQRQMLKKICIDLEGGLKFYNKICRKAGFIEENKSFIKALKRSVIDVNILKNKLTDVPDLILKDKLEDIELIFEKYSKTLRDKQLYDIDDISLMAIDQVENSNVLSSIDSIIIDGFINIDKVNIELIRKLAALHKVNIYINCPYINTLSREFLQREILNPFEAMNFKIVYETEELVKVNPGFRELSEKFYSGDEVKVPIEQVVINKYPCISAEVRETARSIKQQLISGTNAEDIAIFVNNKDEYANFIKDIFKEFSIPIYMNYEEYLSDVQISRDVLEQVSHSDMESSTAEEWVKYVDALLAERDRESCKIVSDAFEQKVCSENLLFLKAKEALEKMINDIRRGFEINEMHEKVLSREEFLDIYKDFLKEAVITPEKPNNSGVKVLNTDLAKGVYYKSVYVLGLNEGEIPKIISNDGLFDEAEVSKLRDLEIQYRDYLWELMREKIRFNLTLASAEDTLTLSYRSSAEDGSYIIASSLLDEVKVAGNIKDVADITMRDRFELPFDQVMSNDELKTMKLRDIFRDKYLGSESFKIDSLYEYINQWNENFQLDMLNGLIEYHRANKVEFNNFEGILGKNEDEVLFSKNSFSPSKLNVYKQCPMKYMFQNLFGLDEIKVEDEFSGMEIGDIYHKALHLYYEGIDNFKILDEDKFKTAFDKAVNEARKVEMNSEELEAFLNRLEEIVKNFIKCDLKRINKYEQETGNIIRPFLLEQFIKSDIFGEEIAARIDRVDLEYKIIDSKEIPTGRYIVYDYKKKYIPDLDTVLTGENCQIAFYYYFVNEYLEKTLGTEELDCMALLYMSVEETKNSIKKNGLYRTEYKKALGFSGISKFDTDKEQFYAILEYLEEVILEIIENIKSGKFNYAKGCKHFKKFEVASCDFEELCRYNKAKITKIVEAER